MAEHTKGEWMATESRLVSGQIDIEAKGLYIAAIPFGKKYPKKEAEANARLIAAAPDLLAACKGVLNIINESCGVDGYHLTGDIAFWSEFDGVVVLEQALTKAEEDK